MKIWRFENKLGLGPYWDSDSTETCTAARYIAKTNLDLYGPSQLAPINDGIDPDLMQLVAPLNDWRFGFASQWDLERWFVAPEGRKVLADNGQELCTFDCPDGFVLKGRTQLAFVRKFAIKLGRLDPLTLKEIENA